MYCAEIDYSASGYLSWYHKCRINTCLDIDRKIFFFLFPPNRILWVGFIWKGSVKKVAYATNDIYLLPRKFGVQAKYFCTKNENLEQKTSYHIKVTYFIKNKKQRWIQVVKMHTMFMIRMRELCVPKKLLLF